MKRLPIVDDGDNKEDAEMDVDDEEKMEVDEGAEDEEEEAGEEEEEEEEEEQEAPSRARQTTGSSVPFLDSFYSLSSTDPQERAQAAQDIIHYCLVGPESNIKDASYALKRLLNGLCSGRAAARQGNASALASFVKVAIQLRKIRDIQSESSNNEETKDETLSELAYIRNRLIAATDPGGLKGKVKRSEERDVKFGRLFGILAVVRSGTLLPVGEKPADVSEILDVTSAYVKDLANLYSYKNWMREPAAHAVGTLLNSFYAICSESSEAVRIVDHLVNNVVVPEVLAQGDLAADTEGSLDPLFATYSAEQIALALSIQSNISFHPRGLPEPIDQAVLTKETIPSVAAALGDTSTVTYPRTHLVWDVLCSFISDPVEDKSRNNVDVRMMKPTCPVSSESVHDLLEALIEHVVIETLLKANQTASPDASASKNKQGKTTHEKGALALCLVRNFSGVEFLSSISGRTRLIVEPGTLDGVVLQPALVKKLFLNTLSAGVGGGGRRQQGPHLLKPLALQVLESIVATFGGSDTYADEVERRLAFAEPLLRCCPQFDSITKTSIVSQLVEMEGNISKGYSKLWDRYIVFLEVQVAKSIMVDDDKERNIYSNRVDHLQAEGYVKLLFDFAKKMKRAGPDDEDFENMSSMERRVIGFLMASAFFDCHLAGESATYQSGKEKKKGSKTLRFPAVESAVLIRTQRSETPALLPYNVRCLASARFYSLVADHISASTLGTSSSEKRSSALAFLSSLIQAWDDLESSGALRLVPQDGVDEKSSDEKAAGEPKSVVKELHDLTERMKREYGSAEDRVCQARLKCSTGFSFLASALYIHLLGCGRPEGDTEDDDPDADDENDASDVSEFLSDLKELSVLYFESDNSDDRLSVLAGLCVNILSSPLASGNQARGASPTILREAIKAAWEGGLMLSASLGDGTESEESDFLSILLESIGIEEKMPMDEDAESGEASDEDESDSDSESAPEAGKDFEGPGPSKGADMDVEEDENEADVELDPTRLQSFLEEDSDADVDEKQLEHHEGADKALAKLIRLKQEARKVGQLARERAESSRQLRCTLLLDTLLNGKADGWGPLLSTDRVLQMFVPILQYRKYLEKSVSNATQKSAGAEKRALLQKLTNLLTDKILKKHSGRRWRDSVDPRVLTAEVAAKLSAELQGVVSQEHRSFCSVALTAVVRAVPEPDQAEFAKKIYEDSVEEWASKKSTRLEASMFEDLLKHCPSIARAVLVSPLTLAAANARTAFLKCEAFRLLSLLFDKASLGEESSDLDKLAFDRILSSVDATIEAFKLSLQDDEMKKAKWARPTFKSVEIMFTFVSSTNDGWDGSRASIRKDVSDLLADLKSHSSSKNLVGGCDKLLGLMGTGEAKKKTAKEVEKEQDGDNPAGEKPQSDSHMSKKKKKKKKTKKRKR